MSESMFEKKCACADEKMKNEDFKYSGENSAWFWDRVNKLPRTEGGEVVYLMGCALQDLEGRVLRLLQDYEAKRFKETK